MATQLWLAYPAATDSTPPGSLSTDADLALLTALDSGFGFAQANTVAGPTSGVQWAGTPRNWWYRVNAVTISGAITKNLWMSESSMSANVGAQIIIDRHDGAGTYVSTVHNSEMGTELPTTRAAQNWATGTVTSTSFAAGDYIRVRVYGNDVGTMASGYTFTFASGASSAGTDGDSYVTFTETIVAYTPSSSLYPGMTNRPTSTIYNL